MKRVSIYILAGILLLSAAISCTKDTLVFPEKVADEGDKGQIDVIAKPFDIKIVGEYDYGFNIIWPEQVSDNLAEVVVSYEIDGDPVVLQITEFNEPYSFYLNKELSVDFTLYSVSKTGLKSSLVKRTVKNKDLYIRELLNSVNVSRDSYLDMKLEWQNPLEQDLKIDVIYPTLADSVHVQSQTSEGGEVIFPALLDSHTLDFTITDQGGNKVTATVPYKLTPISYTQATEKARWTPYTSSPYDGDGGFNISRVLDGVIDGWDNSYASGGGDNKEVSIHFTESRNSNYPSYDNYSLRKPEGPFNPIIISKIDVNLMTPDFGSFPQTIKLIGIAEDGEEMEIDNYTVNQNRKIEMELPENTQKWRGFVLILSNPSFGNTTISEIDVWGYGR